MKNHIHKLLKTSICILLIMSLSGCWNRRELDTLGVVMGVGIDKSIERKKVQVTTQIVKSGHIKQQSNENGINSQSFWNVSTTKDTVFSSLRDITNKSSRKLFFPHNQVLIFDKLIAEDGIQKYIDFFVRDPETRMNVLVLISEGKAKDILDINSELEKLPANNLAKLIKVESSSTSQTRAVMLRDFVSVLMSKTMSVTAPFIKVSKNGDKTVAMISGTAVFKGDKLVGEMTKREGRGLAWVLGDVKSSIIEVEGPNDDKVCLETIRSSGKIIPEINNNKLIIKINVFEEGNIGEQTGTENLSKLPEVASLEKKKAEVIRNEIMAALKKAQDLDADVFGFGEAVHKRYPKEWKSLEGNWDEIFKNIQVEVNIESKLRLIGRIFKPGAPEKEK